MHAVRLDRALCAAIAGWTAVATSVATAQPNPFITLDHEHYWTLKLAVNVRSYQEQPHQRPGDIPRFEVWTFDTVSVVFPLIERTAGHRLDLRNVQSRFTFDDDVVSEGRPELMPRTYHSGARLGRWDALKVHGRELELQLDLPMMCARTTFNEEAAAGVGWPNGPWPAEAASTFEPQMFIDHDADGPYDMEPVRRFVQRWTGGRPQSQPPLVVAKWLAGKMVEEFQLSGQGLKWYRGQLQGIDLLGAPEAIRRGRGSVFDMACALTAVYREAGLPARVVIGWDVGDRKADRDDDLFLLTGGKGADLYAWVEFFLYDETTGAQGWIPVDVARIRRKQTRLARDFMDRPLRYFGTHDELDGLLPFALHFHPPTTVRAYGAPGFWGWFVTPEAPERAFQSLRFVAITTPVTAEQQRERQRRRDD